MKVYPNNCSIRVSMYVCELYHRQTSQKRDEDMLGGQHSDINKKEGSKLQTKTIIVKLNTNSFYNFNFSQLGKQHCSENSVAKRGT